MSPDILRLPVGDNPPTARLYYGQDVRETLRSLPEKSVQTICTSPPYQGLRSYGTEPQVWGGKADCDHDWADSSVVRKGSTNGRADTNSTLVSTGAPKTLAPGEQNDHGNTKQCRTDPSCTCSKCGAWRGNLGLEPDPDLYIEHLVEVFREARRVLRDDGTIWLNLGDTYAAVYLPGRKLPKGIKPKDLVGIPWMAALALQEDGWYLRSDIIWSKPACMPESVSDRLSRNHEYIFLLSKQSSYFYDQDSVREPYSSVQTGRAASVQRDSGKNFGMKPPGQIYAQKREGREMESVYQNGGRNRRTVWVITPKPYHGAHFAVWPPDLARLMILAGSAPRACPKCAGLGGCR